MKPVALRFTTLEGGCMVPISHALNQDGYFRRLSMGKAEMFHRTIYRLHHGEIPQGFEVDHICRNRACCNPRHLQAKSRTQHIRETNKVRAEDRCRAAREYWEEHRPSGAALAARFGVPLTSACRWIRRWKGNGH